jgi:ATP sulfurylase
LAFLLADSQRGDYPPTNQAVEFFNQIKEELSIEISNFKRILNTYTLQLNNMIDDNGIKFISY